jgi:3',5'-cyclic AMP phosphodiesterase CpdA
VSTILHLSDLHLGDTTVWERRTDDKVGLVPAGENARLSVLETSLAAVKRHVETLGHDIDAVVVSGDITSQHDQSGFDRFGELLAKLQLAPPDRTIVVPGNHDVDWASDPGTPGKYERFLQCTRFAGFRTPLCDGVDGEDYATSVPPAQPVLWLNDAVIVSVNTANWCGVRFPNAGATPAAARASGGGADAPAAGRETGGMEHSASDAAGGDSQPAAAGAADAEPTTASDPRSETYDIARVSEVQLSRLTDALEAEPLGRRIRIAVLHHHLLPVTEDEEVKPFESFTNLARLRAWLRDHGFQVVLHGHKHRSTLTWDHIYDLDDHTRLPRRVMVVSAPTPTTWGEPICRLIRIGSPTGRELVAQAPRMVVDTARAVRQERPFTPESTTIALDAGAPRAAGALCIEAETADAAYERLVDALDDHGGSLRNVTCVVRNPATALEPPTNFKQVNRAKQWLEDAVDWWQHSGPELVAVGEAPFNHGERLYSTGNHRGALEIAAEKLGSSKAMALVLRDAELRAGVEAPAFVAVQLVKVTDEVGPRLDCVGYFRKQDLTLWWPVNVGELRKIQLFVLDLRPEKGLRAGHLTTIAVEAISDNVLPELAGTTVDRLVDLRPSALMQLAYHAAHSRAGDAETTVDEWTRVLRDIGEGHDFPSLGIARLVEHLKVFRATGELTDLDLLIKRLEGVYDRAQRAKLEPKLESERDAFSEQLFKQVTEVLDALGDAVRARGD